VIDRNDRHPGVTLPNLDLDRRFRERSVDRGVNRDRVVRVGSAANSHRHPSALRVLVRRAARRGLAGVNSLAGDIDDDCQSTFGSFLLDEVVGQELGNGGGQVDAVDEDVDC
jgi:hypothetical protein